MLFGGTRRRFVRTRQQGFTLIELLIVIVVLGVVAAIVVASVAGITDRGNESACKTDVQAVTNAEMAYYAAQGATAAFSSAATVKSDLVPEFLRSWPTATTITYRQTGSTYQVTGVNGSATC